MVVLQHSYQFNTSQSYLRTEEILEPEHRIRDAFDQSVILLSDVVEVFALAKFHSFGFLLILLPYCRIAVLPYCRIAGVLEPLLSMLIKRGRLDLAYRTSQ
ncbi:MAG: hypothetical protein ACI8UP_002770 [Porticoccaceae bacterium]